MGDSVTVTADTKQAGHTLYTFVESRRFAWLNLACALVAAVLWYTSGGRLGAWPLLVGLLPWGIRLAAGRSPFKQTRFDPLLWLFLISAAVSASISYNHPDAWGKFWLIAGAIILYYAFAGQRAPNIWPIITGLAIAGGAVAIYFLATHDWSAIPAKIEAINRVGLQWMQLRPAALGGLHGLHPNVAGGLMATLFPYALASAMRGFRKGRGGMLTAAGLAGILMSVGLVFTTSRGAWLALAGGIVAWAMWVGADQLAETLYLSRRKVFGLAILLFLGLCLAVVLMTSGSLSGMLENLPGPDSAGSRLEISHDTLGLVGDFWMTGGGLDSFDGLYSQYIRVIPYHSLIHSHNLFLNVAVEQGFIGLAVLIAMLLLAFWWLIDPHRSGYRRSIHGFSLVNGATLAALVAICLHGLVDDPLYGSRGVLLLWLPLGLSACLFPLRKNWIETLHAIDPSARIAIGVGFALVAALLIIFKGPIMSSWQSDLGALEMARIELRGYPTGQWSDGREVVELGSARARFERALQYNADNRTALHRLGLMAMLERDYESAKEYLYPAYLLDHGHQGIRKALMYSYVWSGDIPRALPLLKEFPEATAELGVYEWWWEQQGFPHLGQLAEDARSQLQALISQP